MNHEHHLELTSRIKIFIDSTENIGINDEIEDKTVGLLDYVKLIIYWMQHSNGNTNKFIESIIFGDL